MSNKIRDEFFDEIPELRQLEDVEAPSPLWINKITACDERRREKSDWIKRARIFFENFSTLLYLPKPALSIPALLLAGLLVAQLMPDAPPSSASVSLFDTLLTGGKKI